MEEVSDFEALEGMQIGHATSPLGSGGMRSKVVAAEMATAGGIATVIANGLRPDALARALDGEREGTAFPARESRYSSFKLWLRYAKSPHGTVRIDAGAARALREGGTSLLPVGIVGSRGASTSATRSRSRTTAHVIGKGISNYTAEELRQVKGMKTAEVRDLLPRATEEAVHRDYFVLA